MLGAWCSCCGQESIGEQGAVLRAVQRQWKRIHHTLVALVMHPGQLSTEYRDGMRARSISPWRLAFNVLTVVFLLSFVTGFGAANFPNQDPSGTLGRMTEAAQQQSKLDKVAFMERVDRRFNGIFTAMMTVSVAAFAVMARVTHWRRRESWTVHFVFALHFVAWTFIANLLYFLAMRLFGLSLNYQAQHGTIGATLIALVVIWEFNYLLLALRRVYCDSWIGAGARAVGMLVGGLIVDNGLAILSFYLALWASYAFG
jgi:hypothetical protein